MTLHRSFYGIAALLAAAACSDRPTAPPNLRDVPLSRSADHSGSAGSTASAATPSSVTWETRASAFVAAHSLNPIVGMRAYALVALADYGAVVAASKGDDTDDFEGGGHGASADSPPHLATTRGAVAGASAQVLEYLFPLDATQIEADVSADIPAASPGIQKHYTDGVAIGRAIGDLIVQRGRADGFANPNGTAKVWDPTSLPTGPAIWSMDADATPHVPAGFQFPLIRPYFLTSGDQFRPPPPPADITPGLNVVISTVAGRTVDQAASALFWNFSNGTILPLGYWDTQATAFITEHQLGERDAAHVFALVNAAAMDATIGCWEAKYHYLVRRPWMLAPTALPNSALIIGRPNHPSYPSGHSCASSAAGTVLKAFFPEKSTTLDQQVAAAGLSRIYAGIHYPFDIEQGQVLGASVANWALRYDQMHGILSAVLPPF